MPPFQNADPLSLGYFILLIAGIATILAFAMVRARTSVGSRIAATAYVVGFAAVVASELPIRATVPTVPILFASVFFFAATFAFSSAGLRISETFSFAALVGFQSFRFPLELILHHWAEIGTIPPTMTWTGSNWDLVSGVLALLAIPFANRSRAVVWATQIIGLALLLNVIRVVILSSPFPFSWPLSNPLQLILFLPYALIGPLCVGTAMAGHLLTFRKLREGGLTRAPSPPSLGRDLPTRLS